MKRGGRGAASDDTGELRRIIAIQLPTRDIRQTDGTDLVVPLEQSLTFIREQFARYNVAGSDELPPLVMNFSFGNF